MGATIALDAWSAASLIRSNSTCVVDKLRSIFKIMFTSQRVFSDFLEVELLTHHFVFIRDGGDVITLFMLSVYDEV